LASSRIVGQNKRPKSISGCRICAAEDKLKRLYAMVENGLTELDDILKDRLAALKTDRDQAKEALDRIKLRPKSRNFDA
jgi:hypothetical protein